MCVVKKIVTVLGILLVLLNVQAAAETKNPKGELLFQKFGCTNCHGFDGIHPKSRYAPVLR